MLQKHKLLTILMLALASTLLILTACEKDEDDDPATDDPTNSAPVANFEANQTNIAAGESVTFTDQSTNEPISWSWDFGDGNTSADASPSHTYNSAGSYTVGLTVTNDYGSDTETKTDYITVESGGTGGTVTDIDGNVYNTVVIGDQEWMAENLKTTTYNDGTSIELVENDTDWENNTTGAYCWYDNNQIEYAETYGALYNWHAVNTGNLCPDGWHVPTDEEWTELTDYLGGEEIAGGKMKATGTAYWESPNEGATNESGFSALPGGYRDYNGLFDYMGVNAYFWSSTEYASYTAWGRILTYDYTNVYRDYYYKSLGFSVRCVRDN